jgi:uncharacterized membrane protein YsdA (DUF1294 family)
MLWRNPVRLHLVIITVLCIGGTALGWWFLTSHQHTWRHWLACWLLAANVVTFAYYGFDKYLSSRIWLMLWRVPEVVLHTLAAVGGSPAALLAMWMFRHKTVKQSFRIYFWCIVVLQTALTAYIVKVVWWN